VDSLNRAAIARRLAEEDAAAQAEYAAYAADKVCEDSKKRLTALMVMELDERARRARARLLAGSAEAVKRECPAAALRRAAQRRAAGCSISCARRRSPRRRSLAPAR